MNSLHAMLDCAQRHWPGFPLVHRTKKPFKGSHGFLDATTDPELIRDLWTANPTAGIGLRTGVVFDAIDIDGPTGERSLADVFRRYGEPEGPQVRSGRRDGGRHLLIGVTGSKSITGLLPGVDFKARSGYIVAPPSVHASGRAYTWIVPPNVPIRPAPEWLMRLLAERRRPTERNRARGGMPSSTYVDAIRAFNRRHGVSEVLRRDWGIDAEPGRTIRCPAHDDRSPSLSVAPDDARVWCKSGDCLLSGREDQGHDAFSLALTARQALS